MKRISFFLFILFTLIPIGTVHSQNKVTTIDSLLIDMWPDYDRPSVLVLLTGTLPANTELPASVTLPLPQIAQLNAVARIDSKDGQMKDVFWIPGPGVVMFTTPDLSFRFEYYFPYTVNNFRRSFNYTWLSDLNVNQLQLKIQQPTSASTLSTKPAARNILPDQDGFKYHTFPVKSVPAGQPFSVQVNYQVNAGKLSVENRPSPSAGALTPGSGINWPIVAIIIGGLIIVIVLFRLIAVRRPPPPKRETPETRIEKQSPDYFCNNCDEPADEEDKFCKECGARL